MTTLFNLEDYEVIPRPIDPHWDEVILDCSGRVESSGQTTLFYDLSEEPPDPDDFPNLQEYEAAFEEWRSQYPNVNIQEMSVLEDGIINLSPLPEHKKQQWIEEYPVTRCGVKYWYFRFCWYDRTSRKIHHVHIPGGNTKSAIALERLERVKGAIANSVSPIQIQNLIRGGFQN